MAQTKHKRLTKDEQEYIKKWYGIKTAMTIAKDLGGLKLSTITGWAARHGLKSSLTRCSENVTEERMRNNETKCVGPWRGSRGKTDFQCKFCGKIFQTIPYKVATKHTKSCGCTSIGRRRGTENVSQTYFTSIKQGAKARNLPFEITIEDLDDLFVKQDGKCALSGVQLTAGYANCRKRDGGFTASVDRIDPSKGYTLDNIQWVEKQVNLCKQQLNNDKFITICENIAKTQRKNRKNAS